MNPSEIFPTLERQGFCPLPAQAWTRPAYPEGERELVASWDDLVQDRQMGDGGRYRWRRYSRLRWSDGQCHPLAGSSIFQELHDNPLNGGRVRTFEPLLPPVLENPFLLALVRWNAQALRLSGSWQVGLHCLRVVAEPNCPGLPTPEGIHRDAERFTVQHLIARRQVEGGVFTAYDERQQPIFHWLQLQTWDSLFFSGHLWHSASPIVTRPGLAEGVVQGHRDILLIDFDPLIPIP